MIQQIFEDALFSAIAAIGFASLSTPPRRAYLYCAVIAAAGHSARYLLMQPGVCGMHIVAATFFAALLIGLFAVFLSPVSRMPAETCFFPSLLPMIPGMYAYRCFGAFAMCLISDTPEAFGEYFFRFAQNGITCSAVLLAMVVGATLPVFVFKKISFRATRYAE